MDAIELAGKLKEQTPRHFQDICAALDMLCDELGYTKVSLRKDLMKAQSVDDYTKARSILDTQEELLAQMNRIQHFLNEVGADLPSPADEEMNDDHNSADDTNDDRIDYSQFDMDDTVAYDIEETPVTFKRPAAFSFKGNRYPVTKWKGMLSKLCDLLYKENPSIIQTMANEERQPGQRRVKLSTDQSDMNSPVKISGSNIWIETNRSAANIRSWILILLDRYSVPYEQMKVFFRRDYAALHEQDEQLAMTEKDDIAER